MIDPRLRHIINPKPETFGDNTTLDGDGGRSGQEYDFTNERNKWVIEGIHEMFTNYGTFPEIGSSITLGGPIVEDHQTITLKDAMAYASLYPQNTVIIRLEERKLQSSAVTGFDFTPLSDSEAVEQLQNIYNIITTNGDPASKLLTATDRASYKAVNQANTYLKLPSIMFQSSHGRRRAIRKSFGLNPNEPLIGQPMESASGPSESIQTKQREGLNFLDWTKNVRAPDPRSVVYYNPRDEMLYFTSRTRRRKISSFDISKKESHSYRVAKKSFLTKALGKIISFLEIDYIPSAMQEELIRDFKFLNQYGDRDRPEAPDDISVWLLGGSIPFSLFEPYMSGELVFVEDQVEHQEVGGGRHAGDQNRGGGWKNANRENNRGRNNPGQPSISYKSPASPYQIAKAIIDNVDSSQSAVFDINNLNPTLSKTSTVLSRYADVLAEARITPDLLSGFNLPLQVEKFKEIKNLVPKFISLNNLSDSPTDMVEFRFSKDFNLNYTFHNGYLIVNGLGLNKETLKKDNASENVFHNVSNTAMGYLFYSTEISPLDGENEIPPWTQFITSYTYPNPNENSLFASKNANPGSSLNEEVVVVDSIKKLLLGDSKKSASEKMAKNSGDTKMFPTEDDLKTLKAKQAFITEKELYNKVTQAMGSCDTGLSSALKEAFSIYSLLTQKTRKKDLLAAAIVKAKDAILFAQSKYGTEILKKPEKILTGETVFEFGKLRVDGRNAETYIADAAANGGVPVRLIREIEREVSRQVSCIFEVIGEAFNELVLDPLVDDPGPAKKLVREIAKESDRSSKAYTVNFLTYKTPTRDWQKTWRKQVEKLILEFLKQMILDVFKEVISAILGCGPESSEDKPREAPALDAPYGRLRINLLLENTDKKVNLLKICEELDIKNTILVGDNLDQIQTSPPSQDQLRQFHEDISDACTKPEAEGLLEGNAPAYLAKDLSDMTTDNVDTDYGFLTREQKQILIQSEYERGLDTDHAGGGFNPLAFATLAKNAGLSFTEDGKAIGIDKNTQIKLRMSADSLRAGDTRYATLDFTENKLREYFKKIGEVLGPDALPSSPLVPESAYCAPKDIASDGMGDSALSLDQFALQVQEGTQAELARIFDLCELFNGAFDGFDKSFFDKWNKGIPLAESYRLLLEKIAFLSRLFQSMAADALGFAAQTAGSAPVPARASIEDTQIYQLLNRAYGDASVTPSVSMQPSTDIEDDVNIDIPMWDIRGRQGKGFVSFQVRGNQVFLRGAKEIREGVDRDDIFLGKARLNDNNNPGAPPEQGGIPPRFPTRGYFKDSGRRGGAFRNSFDEYNTEIANIVTDYITRVRPGAARTRFPLAILNPHPARNVVSHFYVTHSDKIRAFNSAMTEPLFEKTGDPCLLIQRERIAISCIDSLQARITNFLYNVGPALTAITFGWKIPDTLDTLAGYLVQKFEYEMSDKKLFDLYLSSMDDVDKTFSGGPANTAGVAFDISGVPSLRGKFELTVKACLETMLYNIGTKSEFIVANQIGYQKDVFSDRHTDLFEHFLAWVRREHPDAMPILNRVIEVYGEAWDPRVWTTQWGPGYFIPVPLINAANIIYYDHVVDVQQKLPAFKFFSEKRIASVDDTFLTAINPQNITAFSDRFIGYPLTVGGKTYYTDQEVKDDISSYERKYEEVQGYQELLGTRLFRFDGNSYDLFGYKPGSQQYNIAGEGQVIQLSNLEYHEPDADSNPSSQTDFWNPLYGALITGFRALPADVKNEWIKKALAFDYAVRNNGSWPNSGEVTGFIDQAKANCLAYYERKRLLEIAGGARNFMHIWKKSHDISRNVNPHAPVGQRTSAGKSKLKSHISGRRAIGQLAGYTHVGNYGSIQTIYGTFKGYENNPLKTVQYPNPGQWGIRNGRVRLPTSYTNSGNFQPPYQHGGYELVTVEQDMLDHWECLLRNPGGIHYNTLEKVAINHLYYLVQRSTANMKKINLEDEYSAVNKLKKHLGVYEGS